MGEVTFGKTIGISGKKGCGKSTLARKLRDADPFAVLRPFAKPLKDVCVNVLGLDPDKVHGTDEDKKALTDIRQCDMPHWKCHYWGCRSTPSCGDCTRALTVREVLQQVGTEVFRRMKRTCWIDSFLRDASGEYLSIADDCRFVDEAEAIKAAGGTVIRLTNSSLPPGVDAHESETALDGWGGFDLVVDVAGKDADAVFREVRARLDGIKE